MYVLADALVGNVTLTVENGKKSLGTFSRSKVHWNTALLIQFAFCSGEGDVVRSSSAECPFSFIS